MAMTFKRVWMTISGTVLVTALISGAAIADRMQASGKISNSCRPDPGQFVVPTGKTASNFRIEGLMAGNTCTTNQTINTKGFQIQDSNYRKVFSYSGSGSISGLTLPAGSYRLYVDGGIGANVTLSFDLK